MEPVQLAIDGNSTAPVLQRLAEDAEFTGTVIVDFYERNGNKPYRCATFPRYANHLPATAGAFPKLEFSPDREPPVELAENHVRSYADGARPLDSLLSQDRADQLDPAISGDPPGSVARCGLFARTDAGFLFPSRVMRQSGDNAQTPVQHSLPILAP